MTIDFNDWLEDHAGLIRGQHPGAGSSSHYYNYSFRASADIEAGGEIFMDYGPNWFKERTEKGKLKSTSLFELSEFKRPVEWLKKHGMCIDNIKVGTSTIPLAGRGGECLMYSCSLSLSTA